LRNKILEKLINKPFVLSCMQSDKYLRVNINIWNLIEKYVLHKFTFILTVYHSFMTKLKKTSLVILEGISSILIMTIVAVFNYSTKF